MEQTPAKLDISCTGALSHLLTELSAAVEWPAKGALWKGKRDGKNRKGQTWETVVEEQCVRKGSEIKFAAKHSGCKTVL